MNKNTKQEIAKVISLVAGSVLIVIASIFIVENNGDGIESYFRNVCAASNHRMCFVEE